METRIAVAGATGRFGRHVLDVLEAFGYPTVAMSRATGVDVVTGESLDEALAGAYAIVDAAAESFEPAARILQRAGARAGVERIVAVSVVGADRGCAARLAHERAMLAGPVPARIVRAPQLHDARAVADRLARLAVIWSWEAVPTITGPTLTRRLDSAAAVTA